ncbi:MAG: DUF7351 domain-containing protein [Halobacteriota archaeon]
MDDRPLVEDVDPEAAFKRLGHQHRLATLLALDEASALTFSDLRERVGADDPGGFNYHLRQLDGLFVEQVEGAYELTPAGRRVVAALHSGAFTSDFVDQTIDTDHRCLRCDGTLQVHLERKGMSVSCRSCELRYNHVEIPPRAVVDHDRGELFDLVERWVKQWITTAEYGVCPRCDGRMGRRVLRADDPDDWGGAIPGWVQDLPVSVVLRYQCERCGETRFGHAAAVAALHPIVAAFHHEHGIDVRRIPLPDLEWLSLGSATVASTDPLRIEVVAEVAGDALRVTFDRDFELVSSDW